jgi:polyphosphate kinase 2 (PPK2 family)
MSDTPSIDDVRAATLVEPKERKSFSLQDRDTRCDKLFESKKDAKASLDEDAIAINELQDALFACKGGSLLVVLQGIDTAGKDGTTKECFKYTSPLGVQVSAFGKPTEIELSHDYLWRIHQVAPRKGTIANAQPLGRSTWWILRRPCMTNGDMPTPTSPPTRRCCKNSA